LEQTSAVGQQEETFPIDYRDPGIRLREPAPAWVGVAVGNQDQRTPRKVFPEVRNAPFRQVAIVIPLEKEDEILIRIGRATAFTRRVVIARSVQGDP
jgi:hypothetical protein